MATPLAILLFVELGVRIIGVEPQPWPALGEAGEARGERFPGIEVDPLLGPLPRPGWSGRWFDRFEVEIDQRGFRDTGLPRPDPPEAKIAFLGDSCSFGWDVDTPETYVARLDAIQRENGPARFWLVNGAYPGNTSVVGLHKLRDRIAPLEPDWVVLAFSANNAFRFATSSDAQRFRNYALRRLGLRWRLVQIVASRVANARARENPVHPRDRDAISALPLDRVERVAKPDEFEAALRQSILEVRAEGAQAVLLLLPRASQVADEHTHEDTALSHRDRPLRRPVRAGRFSDRQRQMVEYSCLDPQQPDLSERLSDGLKEWRPVRPVDPQLRQTLSVGASAFFERDLEAARRAFSTAVQRDPTSPIALYDLGVAEIESGNVDAGLRHLEQADRLACNAFLHYQVRVRQIGVDLGVPVVDVVLLFQAHDGEALYLDAAHPSVRGHRLIGDALWRFFEAAGRV